MLATGGGAITRERSRRCLKERGTVVYLHATPDDAVRPHPQCAQPADAQGRGSARATAVAVRASAIRCIARSPTTSSNPIATPSCDSHARSPPGIDAEGERMTRAASTCRSASAAIRSTSGSGVHRPRRRTRRPAPARVARSWSPTPPSRRTGSRRCARRSSAPGSRATSIARTGRRGAQEPRDAERRRDAAARACAPSEARCSWRSAAA